MDPEERGKAPQRQKIIIKKLASGVSGLDFVLGGGIPELSVNVIAGGPGSGKTTLIQQIIFRNADAGRPAIFFTALGEPSVKMLRYQQQFDFFDPAKIQDAIRFVDLSQVLREKGLQGTLQAMIDGVTNYNPSIVALDSLRAIEELTRREGDLALRSFVFDLAMHLAVWQVTSFLIGEYDESELRSRSELGLADGIIWLSQDVHRNAMVRKLRVIKMRGQAPLPGQHTFRLDERGIHVFPRFVPLKRRGVVKIERPRLGFGVPGLDEMMYGGIPQGETCMVAGNSGTGKTVLGLQFLMAGARQGEPAVMATFEEDPEEHSRKAAAFGWDLPALEQQGLLEMLYLRPTDLSVDEVFAELYSAVERLGAKRVVINSISGFELALAPAEVEDFREALYRLVVSLGVLGVTTILISEVPQLMGQVQLTAYGVSFLADDIILLRYVEIQSALRKAVTVVKMRTSEHDKEMREYAITRSGIVVKGPFTNYSGVLSGIPTLQAVLHPEVTVPVTNHEESLLHLLLAVREATPEELAESLGLDAAEARSTLEQLEKVNYVTSRTSRGKKVYRVTLGVMSPQPKRPSAGSK